MKTTRGKRCVQAVVIIFMAGTLVYGAWLAVRAARLYRVVKSDGRSWDRPIHCADASLGYALIPGVDSVERYPGGYSVPVRIDPEGFRVPADPARSQDNASPRVLALGCSFTFGMACKAEETFPYRVADAFGGSALNAGVGGYGLVHMVLRARQIVPKYAPDWVLVEYAPWLIDRSLQPVSSAVNMVPTPSPYFAALPDGRLGIEPPPFTTNYFEHPVRDYSRGASSVPDFASFLWRAALPVYAWADAQVLRYHFQRHAAAAADTEALVRTFYTEIADTAQRCRSRVCIVILGNGGITPDQLPRQHVRALHAVPNVILADAYRALYERLPQPTPEAYEQAYGIWDGAPRRLVDRHPNADAHGIIAETILSAMKQQ